MRGRRGLVVFTVAVLTLLFGASILFMDDLTASDVPGLAAAALAVVVALITLWYVVPAPAKVIVVRQDELGLDDLIFYLVDLPVGRVPRDFLLQLHVAVANVGGRKAVVSRVAIDQFFDASGTAVDLPGATKKHGATRYSHRSGWRDGQRYFQNEMDPGRGCWPPMTSLPCGFELVAVWTGHRVSDCQNFERSTMLSGRP